MTLRNHRSENDPRVKRTKALLRESLYQLLRTKSFDGISVNDIAESATVNRATFYAHYTDKYELLNAMTSTRFQALLDQRGVRFDGTCESALRMIFLGVCDYLKQTISGSGRSRHPVDPYLESAILSVVRAMCVDGLKQQPEWRGPLPLELVATIVSWALFGAAREWAYLARRPKAEAIVDDVVVLLAQLIHPSANVLIH
jgi:AcrR family transcriptional regulator